MSKVCPNNLAVAYNNKAYALFQVGDYAKIGVTGRPMQDRIKEHDRDIQVSDLKTARTPCCFRQLRSCSDRPLT